MKQPITSALITEIWKPVIGWEGLYSVSDLGRFRGEDRSIQTSSGHPQRIRGRIIEGSPNQSGHLQVLLCNAGYEVPRLIHRLILEAFVGPCPEGMEGCHWDDNPANNALSNLRWGTDSDNSFDSVRNGNHPQARKKECKRGGHPLEAPNLVPGHLKLGKRSCLACSRARSYIHTVRPDLKDDFQKVADSYYEAIVKQPL